jgi:pilus assembly protein CpaC
MPLVQIPHPHRIASRVAALMPHGLKVAAAAIALGVMALPTAPALAQEQRSAIITFTSADTAMRPLSLGMGKSIAVDLPRDVKDVLVGNPKIANAVVRSTRRVFIMAGEIGQTTIVFFDDAGRQIGGLDVAVTRDLNGIRAAMRRVLPEANITVEGMGDGVILHGAVANAGESQQAVDMAARLVGGVEKITNALTIRARDQVMLKVTVAEVQREALKQLGVNIGPLTPGGNIGGGSTIFQPTIDNPLTSLGRNIAGTAIRAGTADIGATVRAMEQAGVLRTLAEPTLTAISGESATFLVGGEFPVPVGRDSTGQITLEFKKFGVGLNFTPIVLSEGRISLKLLTEVSELTQEGAINIGGVLSIPALRVRRADTSVEIPSGGALALAGLIREETKQSINGLPGAQSIPVLGTLFRSRDYVNRQTELMILVTPYIVRATQPRNLARPDDGFANASDPSTVFLGRLNRIYGVAGQVDPRRPLHGRHGFILD